MEPYAELIRKIKAYDPELNEAIIVKAYKFSEAAHATQKRASGEPYITHPLAVAEVLTTLKLDTASILTALLHDTVEDTDITLDDIKREFGKEVAGLVDGVTKLTRLELQTKASKQAENFRKLVLAMSHDIRVILVKLADRVHNMQTLHHFTNPEKRQRIALETLEIYAPLAERMGIGEFKEILEDIGFCELYSDAYHSIQTRLNFLREEGQAIVNQTVETLKDVLKQDHIIAEVYGREKRPYSIWRKMQRRNIPFEQLTDIIAFRVIVDTLPMCYQALGSIHSHFSMIPDRFEDYISTPKPNGYQSIHTGVFGPERHRIEIQIRTRDMHEVAELGIAAHWQYKQGHNKDGTQYRWLRELIETLDQTRGADEFLEHTRLEMFKDQVFCFTPKGDVYALPQGATPVDLAYAIHSEIGDHCVGAKINGKMMPLRTILHNGDQVELVTSKTQTPSPEWERFVATAKARARIRRFIRLQKRDQYIALGKEILPKVFKQEQQDYTEKALDTILSKFQCENLDDLYAEVGAGLITGRDVVVAVHPSLKEQSSEQRKKRLEINKTRNKKSNYAIPIRGLIPGMALHLARCCHPLPGDRIVGIVTTGKGVTVHTIDCDTLENFSEVPERWLDLAWDKDASHEISQYGRLRAIINNEPGGLSALTTVIAKAHGNISNLKITKRSTDFFEIIVDVEVVDVKHLMNIIAALRANPMINSVERARN